MTATAVSIASNATRLPSLPESAPLESTAAVMVGFSGGCAFAGSALNLLICSAILLGRRRRGVKPVDIYLAGIASADLLQSCIYLPCVAIGNAFEEDLFGVAGCFFLTWLQTTCVSVIWMCHCALALYWMSLTFTADVRLMQRKGCLIAVSVVIASWAAMGSLSAVSSSRDSFFSRTLNYHCTVDYKTSFQYAFMAIRLVPSLTLTPIGYAITFVRIVQFETTVGGGRGRSGDPGDCSSGGSRGSDGGGRGGDCDSPGAGKEIRMLRSTIAMFVIFAAFYVMSAISRLATNNEGLTLAGYCLLYLTCVVNAPLMLAVNQDYGRALRWIFVSDQRP